MRAKRLGLLLTVLAAALLSRAALAHAMGNFSVNHYSRITLGADAIRVQYLIDLAEIPAYQELQQGAITADPRDPLVTPFLVARAMELARGLRLTVNGIPLTLRVRSREVIFPPGAGGLPTMKMGFAYEAAYPDHLDRAHVTLRYTDANYAGHTGWKEIIATSTVGSLSRSSVPQADRSAALSNYPTDLLSSPPQDLEATIEAQLPPPAVPGRSAPPSPQASAIAPRQPAPAQVPAKTRPHSAPARQAPAPAATPSPILKPAPESALHLHANRQATPRSRFTELITAQHLGTWFLLTAALIAAGLGSLHALEPGHGKTIVAAYLVGSRGTARHAALLGLIVTASHTAGVFARGAITLCASRYIVPEQLYPWLGVLSGLTIIGLGGYMLLRRLTGAATDHSHLSGNPHGFRIFGKLPLTNAGDSGGEPLEGASVAPVSLPQLFALGITGGIIPCPAALIVLLSAFALHRIALGFFLIVAFSLGLAAVLIGFGTLMVYARRSMSRLQVDGPLTRRWLPVASSACITVLGVIVTTQALAATHISRALLAQGRLGPALFVTGLGLLLGVRHSTDADHVVAISTIVSKQRSIRNAALIGSVWGLGHTITIFIVGSLIILFGVEIPPRLGLAMEFSVAVMLILLGVLNLTGILQKVTSRFGAPGVSGNPRSRWSESSIGRFGLYQFARPLVIGLVHGLAGSAAVALLVLSTIHNPVWATAYLLIFGAGTMVGMMCMTAAIAVPLTYAGDRFGRMSRYFGLASGVASLCFGFFLVYQLGFLGGLFTSHPQWTPK